MISYRMRLQGELTLRIAVSPLIHKGDNFLNPPEYNERGTDTMHDFFEVFKMIGVIVSIARLILELVRYINGHKKK